MGNSFIRSAAVVGRGRYASGLLVLAALLLFFLFQAWLWDWLFNDHTKPTELLKTSITEWLDYCSPFETLDGQRTLTFPIADHSLVAAEAMGEEKAKGVLLAAHPQDTNGTWAADEETHRVTVEIDGTKADYTLLVSFSEDQCILVSGSLSGADLTSSLFATPYFPEPERPAPDP